MVSSDQRYRKKITEEEIELSIGGHGHVIWHQFASHLRQAWGQR